MLTVKEVQDAIWKYRIWHEVPEDLDILLNQLDETLGVADNEIEDLKTQVEELEEEVDKLTDGLEEN